MNCTHDLESLVLYHAGELDPSAESAVEKRLAECDSCREELELVARTATSWEAPELDPAEVAAARTRAYARMGSSWRVRRQRLVGLLTGVLGPLRPLPELALGALLLTVGYLLGARSSPAEEAALAETRGVVLDIRDIRVDPETGVAEIRFDHLQEGAVRGGLGDPELASMLQSAMVSGSDDRIRLHALKTVRELAPAGAPAPEVAQAVVTLVRNEPRDALRLRAILALDALFEGRSLTDDAQTALLDAMLSGAGDGVRIAALEVLMKYDPRGRDAGRLIHLSISDPNPYIRMNAQEALDQLGSVPLESLPE